MTAEEKMRLFVEGYNARARQHGMQEIHLACFLGPDNPCPHCHQVGLALAALFPPRVLA